MAYIENTAFEAYVSNGKRNDLQNVTGKFGTVSDDTFTGEICSAGFLCTQNSLIPNEGYESSIVRTTGSDDTGFSSASGYNNSNSWYMVAAESGEVTGKPGDHTGIYACNSYDVNKATDSTGAIVINLPGLTLGLALPKDEYGDFTEIIVGEIYNFGAGNFSTAPTSSLKYVSISSGLLVAQSAAPTSGVYFKVLNADADDRFTVGAYDGGAKYTLQALRV